jgi:5-hydroxyisourate hydrolase
MSQVSAVTTHVLDTAKGTPAVGVAVRLERAERAGESGESGESGEIARGRTDADGRIRGLGPPRLPAGTYRLVFETGPYLAGQGHRAAFFPEVIITFALDGDAGHCHVPLLLSPFAYSTYRGS